MKVSFNISPTTKAAEKSLTADQIQARFREGLALQNNQQLVQATRIYLEVLRHDPRHFDALHMLGVLSIRLNHAAQALQYIRKAIEVDSSVASAHSNLGNALCELRDFQSAVASYDAAIRLKPDHINAHFNRGIALQELKQYQASIACYERVIAMKADHADAYANRGVALSDMGQHEDAVDSFDHAVALRPEHAMAWSNRGVALYEMKRYRAAVDSCDKAITVNPAYADAYCNRGVALKHLRQHQDSIASLDKAIALNPKHLQAHFNRGVALGEHGQFGAAIISYSRAIEIDSSFADAFSNRGNMQSELGHYQDAIDSYRQALAIQPNKGFIFGLMLHAKMRICDWSDIDSQLAEMEQRIGIGEKVTTPFSFLALSNSPVLQRRAAELWVKDQYPLNGELGDLPKRLQKNRIRLGYFSMDFKNHPVSFLTAELFEIHDRDRFETIAFSFGSDTQDEMRKRLESAFDKFVDVRDQSDREIAELARKMEIDIAIDLSGLTGTCRTGIFSRRVAPLQVSYLGYPGTMGAEYMDYVIADRQLIPNESERYYSEKIVYLPSFQANDRKRKISDMVFSREELGLPNNGFVFCCFSNSFKITPSTFDCWMRVLNRVNQSVIFLYADNESVAINLKMEASRRGVDANRLVFGKKLPAPEYLARYRVADLFLDTLPFNAGATASDALWAGLPILTCTGDTFASRMAASVLTAIGLQELVTSSQSEYETLAVELAANPERLRVIRQKLERNRLDTLLFDTKAFTKHMEDALVQMHENYHAGLPAANIYVEND